MAAQTAVEWQILLEDDAWNDDETRQSIRELASITTPAQTRRGAPVEMAIALLLLLALLSYALWTYSQAVAARQDAVPRRQAAVSADRLAQDRWRVLTTAHLRIQAGGTDVAVAAAAAAAMDTLYTDMFRAVGVPLTHGAGAPDGRFMVTVRGSATADWDAARGHATLPSPTRLAAPGGMQEDELLRQSWTIALVDRAVDEAAARHRVPVGWQPLRGGLRLWLLWDAGGPLAESRGGIVRWRYSVDEKPLPFVARTQICQTFATWNLTPLDYSVPLACGPADQSGLHIAAAPDTLAGLDLPEAEWNVEGEQGHPSEQSAGGARSVALALLIDYATETHGRETLPVLLAALGRHNSWETLIPAVYGVSAEVFETGWREHTAYLALHRQ